MGGKVSREEAQAKIQRANAEAKAAGEEQGKRIMQQCYADLQRQLEATRREQGKSQEWMKETMDAFLQTQTDMKGQYEALLQSMSEREERNAEERRNTELKHEKHMEMMKEESERNRRRNEEREQELYRDKKQEMDRLQQHNESAMKRQAEDHNEHINRVQGTFDRQLNLMKEENEKMEKRSDAAVETLKGQMKEERLVMQKNLEDKERAAREEIERAAMDHTNTVKLMREDKEELKGVMQANLDKTDANYAAERGRLEKKNEEWMQSMKEDTERERAEHKEQRDFLKEAKEKSDAQYEQRFQNQDRSHKEYMDKMLEVHGNQMQLTWKSHFKDKEMMTQAFNTIVQGLLQDKSHDREATDRREQRMLDWITDRDKRHDSMVDAFMTRDRQLEGRQPQMVGYRHDSGYPQSGGYAPQLSGRRLPSLTAGNFVDVQTHGRDSYGPLPGYARSLDATLQNYGQDPVGRLEQRPGNGYEQAQRYPGYQPISSSGDAYYADRGRAQDPGYAHYAERQGCGSQTHEYGRQHSSSYDRGSTNTRDIQRLPEDYPRQGNACEPGLSQSGPRYGRPDISEQQHNDTMAPGGQKENRRETDYHSSESYGIGMPAREPHDYSQPPSYKDHDRQNTLPERESQWDRNPPLPADNYAQQRRPIDYSHQSSDKRLPEDYPRQENAYEPGLSQSGPRYGRPDISEQQHNDLMAPGGQKANRSETVYHSSESYGTGMPPREPHDYSQRPSYKDHDRQNTLPERESQWDRNHPLPADNYAQQRRPIDYSHRSSDQYNDRNKGSLPAAGYPSNDSDSYRTNTTPAETQEYGSSTGYQAEQGQGRSREGQLNMPRQ